jgi:ABC-type nitrate/sulfonate/bicarbonate transport system ATPase subunit
MITLNSVAIGYNGIAIQKDISYNFAQGQIHGICGESGKGKTTLLKTIAGLIHPISGDIERQISTKDIYMMHQAYTCFDWLTCLDNILITEKVKHNRISNETIARATQALRDVGLFDHQNRYPAQLSGGQRQRLALARTMFTNPPVILMDEPLSALDEVTRRKMQDLILKKHQETGNTIIMITHSAEEAQRMCDKIMYL